MGWWKTGQGDDVIGDDPADTLQDAFGRVVNAAGAGDQPLFSHAEFLDFLLAALRLNPAAILAGDPDPRGVRLKAEIGDRETAVESSDHPGADERLVRTLYDAFVEIAGQYLDSELARKPRLSELLAAVSFILGYRGKSYARITEPGKFKRIEAIPGKP